MVARATAPVVARANLFYPSLFPYSCLTYPTQSHIRSLELASITQGSTTQLLQQPDALNNLQIQLRARVTFGSRLIQASTQDISFFVQWNDIWLPDPTVQRKSALQNHFCQLTFWSYSHLTLLKFPGPFQIIALIVSQLLLSICTSFAGPTGATGRNWEEGLHMAVAETSTSCSFTTGGFSTPGLPLPFKAVLHSFTQVMLKWLKRQDK